jgi:hypothetical protein
MDSLEKLRAAIAGTSTATPDDEGTARLIQTLQVAGPILGELIPDTAEELDQAILGIATWMLSMRSDDSPAYFVAAEDGSTTGELNAARARLAEAAMETGS